MGLMEMKTEQKRERRDKSKQCDQRKGSQQAVGDSTFNNFASQTVKTEGIRSAGPNALIHPSNPAHKTEGGITSHCCPQVLLHHWAAFIFHFSSHLGSVCGLTTNNISNHPGILLSRTPRSVPKRPIAITTGFKTMTAVARRQQTMVAVVNAC